MDYYFQATDDNSEVLLGRFQGEDCLTVERLTPQQAEELGKQLIDAANAAKPRH